jgi:F-type H+-transporting ATPase subunit b
MIEAPLVPVVALVDHMVALVDHMVALVYLNTTMAFQIVSFLVLVAFLNKYAFRPILHALDERAASIKQSLDQARETVAEAETDREHARHELDEARRESYAIRTQAREIADGERERILDGAKAEAEQVIAKTQREIAQSVELARESLRERAGTLAVQVAEKLLRTELSDEQRRKATTVYLDETEGL